VFSLVYVTLQAPKNYRVDPRYLENLCIPATKHLNCLGKRCFGLSGAKALSPHQKKTTRCIPEQSFKTRCSEHPAQHCSLLTRHTIILLSGGTQHQLPNYNRSTESNCLYCQRTFLCLETMTALTNMGKCMNGEQLGHLASQTALLEEGDKDT